MAPAASKLREFLWKLKCLHHIPSGYKNHPMLVIFTDFRAQCGIVCRPVSLRLRVVGRYCSQGIRYCGSCSHAGRLLSKAWMAPWTSNARNIRLSLLRGFFGTGEGSHDHLPKNVLFNTASPLLPSCLLKPSCHL